MRKIYSPTSGADVTSSVVAALQAGKTLVTPYLYSWRFISAFNVAGWCTYTFTDAVWPIFAEYLQLGANGVQQIGTFEDGPTVTHPGLTFVPEAFRVDKLSYGIGFEDKPAELTWAINDTNAYGVLYDTGPLTGVATQYPDDALSPAALTLKQALAYGVFTECPFWIHQAIYSDFGDLLGVALMFRGYIRSVSASRSLLKIKLSSLMDVFQQIQFPTQTLTPNNRALPYIPAASSPYGSDFVGVTFAPQVIVFSTSESVPANALQDSYMVSPTHSPTYYSGFPATPAFRIQGNSASSGGFITVYFYEEVVVAVDFPYRPSFYSQLGTTGGSPGFENIPPPEFSA